MSHSASLKAVGRAWCWTLYQTDEEAEEWANLHALDEIQHELPFDVTPFQYIAWQPEHCPITMKRHLQGYLETRMKCSGSAVKGLMVNKVHLEKRLGTQAQAMAYIQKSETRCGPFMEFGEPMKQGARSDLTSIISHLQEGKSLDPEDPDHARAIVLRGPGLRALQQELHRARAMQRRDTLRVTVIIGPTRVGKTTLAHTELGLPVYTAGPILPGGGRWFDGYIDQPVFLIDDFKGDIKYQQLLQMLDTWPTQLPARGGDRHALYTHVYITSNYHVNDWYPLLSRAELAPLAARIHRTIVFTAPGVSHVALTPFRD